MLESSSVGIEPIAIVYLSSRLSTNDRLSGGRDTSVIDGHLSLYMVLSVADACCARVDK